MKRTLPILATALALGLAHAGLAQDAESARDLDRMEIVFDTAPIRLAPALAATPALVNIRQNITFILDPDLVIATEVFQTLPAFATPEVRVVESLEAVRAELADGGPWGVVNLVAHGSPQTGLKVRVEPDGAFATAATLTRSPASSASAGVDGDTVVRVYACGLAAAPDFLTALGGYLGSDPDSPPQVVALREFVEFADRPELAVRLRPSLSVVARSRMAARRSIEGLAAAQGRALPSRWERDLDVKPLAIELPVACTAACDGERIAARSRLVRAELDRLGASPRDFEWVVTDGVLRGTAVVGHVPLTPPRERTVLTQPAAANWIAARPWRP